ncbi:unnamed protein product [Calypogeia fissa]
MYLYYLLAATIAKDERRRRKYLFWGKYLTMMQMVQFLSFIGQSIYAMLRPETYPNGVPRVSSSVCSSASVEWNQFFITYDVGVVYKGFYVSQISKFNF